MEDIVKIFKALADENRIKILFILSKRRICGKGIARHLGLTEAAVSQHLKILREAGLIYGEKNGYYVHYIIKPEGIEHIYEFLGDLKNRDSASLCHINIEVPGRCGIKCKSDKNICCKNFKEE